MDDDKDSRMARWFALIKRRNELIREESDLMYRSVMFYCYNLQVHLCLQGESKKVAPYDFQRYFRLGRVFLHKILCIYWQVISTYVYQFSFIYVNI